MKNVSIIFLIIFSFTVIKTYSQSNDDIEGQMIGVWQYHESMITSQLMDVFRFEKRTNMFLILVNMII